MRVQMGMLLLAATVAAACGDPDTTDDRGYTKAPLENPTVLIEGEEPSDVSAYGEPNRVVADRIELPERDETPADVQPAAPVALPEGVTQEMVSQGQQIFAGAGSCFACHGPTGGGSPLAPALNDSEWLHITGELDEIVQIVTTGVPTPIQFPAAMPAKGGAALTDEQVRHVAAYIYSISR